ncbi:MAG: hypothetical protein IJ806_10385 [Ruminococcus sp.]|nr:hypothetical protein [Ruminococcus sp.]
MLKSKLPLGIAAAFIFVGLFSFIVIKYALNSDPTKDLKTSDSSRTPITTLGDIRADRDSSGSQDMSTDAGDVTVTVRIGSSEPDLSSGGDSSGAVTQSTELSNKKKNTTTGKKTTTTTAKKNNEKLVKLGAELDTLAKAYNKAADALNTANEELDAAREEEENAQAALNDAKDALDRAKELYDDGQADNYRRGAAAFYDQNGSSAASLLTGDELAGYTSLGGENDATSLDNMKRAIELLKECNDLRADEGKSRIMVSDVLMALSQLNANAEEETGDSMNRSPYAEILAFGFDDPFDAWYYDERDSDGGHFVTMTSENFVAMGMGYNSNSAGRGSCHSMLFATDDGLGTLYSVDDYAAKFEDFYNSAIKGRYYSEQEDAVNAASERLENAKKDVISKEATVKTANKAYEEAKADYEEKEAEYNEAKDS